MIHQYGWPTVLTTGLVTPELGAENLRIPLANQRFRAPAGGFACNQVLPTRCFPVELPRASRPRSDGGIPPNKTPFLTGFQRPIPRLKSEGSEGGGEASG